MAARRGAGEDETVQWSVMGVVSFIPLINWTVRFEGVYPHGLCTPMPYTCFVSLKLCID